MCLGLTATIFTPLVPPCNSANESYRHSHEQRFEFGGLTLEFPTDSTLSDNGTRLIVA